MTQAARPRLRGRGEQVRQVKEAYLFLLAGRHHAASLAAKLGVSVPTASRVILLLRKELARSGRRLVSVHSGKGFHYEVRDDSRPERIVRDPLVTLSIPARKSRRGTLKAEDRELYEWD